MTYDGLKRASKLSSKSSQCTFDEVAFSKVASSNEKSGGQFATFATTAVEKHGYATQPAHFILNFFLKTFFNIGFLTPLSPSCLFCIYHTRLNVLVAFSCDP